MHAPGWDAGILGQREPSEKLWRCAIVSRVPWRWKEGGAAVREPQPAGWGDSWRIATPTPERGSKKAEKWHPLWSFGNNASHAHEIPIAATPYIASSHRITTTITKSIMWAWELADPLPFPYTGGINYHIHDPPGQKLWKNQSIKRDLNPLHSIRHTRAPNTTPPLLSLLPI